MNADENTKSMTQTLINIGYNFGDIYDDLEAFYFFLVQTPYYNGASIEQGGAFLGNIVWWATSMPTVVNNSTQAQSPMLRFAQTLTMKAIRLVGMKYA
jgi:hypothetical protein